MCRRCGEPDKRGNVTDRRRRKLWLINTFGDGVKVPCVWCATMLDYATLTVDRLVAGGTYRRENIVPSCQGCQWARTRAPIPDGCAYG